MYPPHLPSYTTGRKEFISMEESHASSAAEAVEAERKEWEAEFAAAARRTLRVRFRYAFIYTYKPVLDDESYRSFDSTAEYREWCEDHLPSWLGYGQTV